MPKGEQHVRPQQLGQGNPTGTTPLQGSLLADPGEPGSESTSRELPRDSTWDLRVICVLPSGAPAVGAVVRAFGPGPSRLIGSCGEDGSLVASLPLAEDSELVATFDELASDPYPIQARAREEVVLVLREAGNIEGRVVAPSGDVGLSGIVVVAVSVDNRRPDPERFSRYAAGQLGPECALSDESGHFQITGLDPHGVYKLIVGGRGYVAPMPMVGLKPGSDRVQVRTQTLYGAVLRAVDQDGHAPRLGGVALPYGRSSSSLGGSGAKMYRGGACGAVLAGVPLQAFEPRADDRLHLGCHSIDAGSIGPLVHRVSAPGYAPIHLEFDLLPITGGLREYTVEYQQSVTGWGSLEVSFACDHLDPAQVLEPASPPLPEYVELRAEDGSQSQFLLRAAGSGAVSCENIPAGEYQVAYVSEVRGLRYPAKRSEFIPLSIEHGQQAKLSIPCTACGVVEFVFNDTNRGLHGGDVYLEVGKGDPYGEERAGAHRLGSLVFTRAPYCVDRLPPGTYSFQLGTPSGFTSNGARFGVFRVSSGETTQVTLLR